MKPTSSGSNQRPSNCKGFLARKSHRFLHTDYHFQSTAEPRAGARPLLGSGERLELRSFRRLSREFLGTETSRNFLIEGTLFVLITALAAWPIASMIQALALSLR